MNKFTLSSAFIIGHEDIDAQHSELVDLLNSMVDSYEDKDLQSCEQIWHKFIQALENHFQSEKKIMHDFGFVSEAHDKQDQRVLEHTKKMGENNHKIEDWEVCLYTLRDDLLSWVLRNDLKFAEHLVTIGYNN